MSSWEEHRQHMVTHIPTAVPIDQPHVVQMAYHLTRNESTPASSYADRRPEFIPQLVRKPLITPASDLTVPFTITVVTKTKHSDRIARADEDIPVRRRVVGK